MALSHSLYCAAASVLADSSSTSRQPSQGPLHSLLTLPIIGSLVSKWNVFSIFLCHEIFIATARKMT
jgi:hypothetical protein